MDKLRSIAVALFLAFAIVLAALIVAAVTYDKNFTKLSFDSHEPIFIDGNDDLLEANGVVSGSGTELDPYVIEGWHIQTYAGSGITINHTDACLVIRNVSIESTHYAYGYEKIGTGLTLNGASNARMENVEIHGYRVGTLLNGSADTRCENLTLSQSRFSSNLFQVVARNTTDLEIDHIITQPGDYDSGIQLDNCTAFSVRSCIIQSFGLHAPRTTAYGILVGGSSDGVLEDNLMRWPDDYNTRGIWIESSTAVRVAHNDLEEIKEKSVWVEASTDISVTNNMIEGWNNGGILILNSSGFLVADNEFRITWRATSGASIGASHSENGTIRNNSLVECGGISAYDCVDILISDNLVDRSGLGGFDYAIPGLNAEGADIKVSRNIVTNCLGRGISVNGNNITVEDNEVSNNCNYTRNSYPVAGVLATGTNLTIVGNEIRNNTHDSYYMGAGVMLYTVQNSTLSENYVSDDVSVVYCAYIDVVANHFHGKQRFTFFDVSSSADIAFFGNSFFDNISVDDDMTSGVLLWDAAYPTGGNYWSQYPGEDLKSGSNQNQPGSDGIGDVPYELSPGEWDNYPLMTHAAISDVTSPMTHAILSGERGTLGWYKSQISVSLTANDTRGAMNTTFISLDGGAWENYSSAIQVSEDGRHLLEFYSVDANGNVEPKKTIELLIDTTPPHPLQTVKTEYRFKGVERGYIYPEFVDNTSTLNYYWGTAGWWYFGYYTTCSFLSLGLSDGTTTYTVNVSDMAGNEVGQNFTVQTTLHPNTNIRSFGGPYGPFYSVALVCDVALLIAALVAFDMSRDRPPPKIVRREEGDRHYDEEVVDGYPKYMKRA